jgi:hypothetical protein
MMPDKAGVATDLDKNDCQSKAIAEVSLKDGKTLRINTNIKKKGESHESRFCSSE